MTTTLIDMPSAGDAREVLTGLLLRAPRRPGGGLWFAATEVLPEIREWEEDPPVAGVMTREDPDGRTEVILLTKRDSIDVETLRSNLEWDVSIELREWGEPEPAARPALGGDSISGDLPSGDTGTVCCLVENQRGDRFVLGCNHTIAGVNRGVGGRDAVLQPGADDGGISPADRLGTLTEVKAIELGGYNGNVIDAAIAKPDTAGDAGPGIREIGPIKGIANLRQGDRVQKMGLATRRTFGTAEFGMSFTETFAGGETALFTDQHAILGDAGAFALRGDSGAAVLSEGSDKLVGMVIAVVPRADIAVVGSIAPILDAFEVTPVLGSCKVKRYKV